MANTSRQKRPTPAPQLESHVLESVQRYMALLNTMSDVVYDVDLVKNTVSWNEAFYKKFGYPKKDNESPLEWWMSHVHPDDALKLENKISEWADGHHELWEAAYRYRKADGSYLYIRDRGILLRAADGTVVRIIGSFIDITTQVQLDRAKDEFISLVSHQLRTPLTAIRMNSSMLASGYFGPLSSAQQLRAKEMTDASVQLIRLVGDILDTSRIELGHIIVNPIPTDTLEFLQHAIDSLMPLAASKKVTLKLSMEGKYPKLPLDITIFGRIVHNLITNAIIYSKSRNACVTVTFERNGNGYLLSVRDNGIGIPREDQEHVFKRFYRAGNSVYNSEQGAGLGLFIVKHLAEASGCTVRFTSTKGRGTTFFVQLPPGGMSA